MVDGVYDLSQADQRKAAAEKALLAASRMAQEAPDIRYSVRGDEADEYLDNKSVAAVVKCFMELFLRNIQSYSDNITGKILGVKFVQDADFTFALRQEISKREIVVDSVMNPNNLHFISRTILNKLHPKKQYNIELKIVTKENKDIAFTISLSAFSDIMKSVQAKFPDLEIPPEIMDAVEALRNQESSLAR